jgi:hypothetical protein
VSEAEQTYTLGPDESFRLDSCSFTVGVANEGTSMIPTLIAQDGGGFTIAEIAAPALQVVTAAGGPIAYSGPAAFSDQFSVLPPDGYGGYTLHDFGAGVTTSQITLTWLQPPGQQAFVAETWLSSPGAASMGAIIGTETVVNEDTVTVQLTSGIAAGHHLLLHVTLLSSQNWINPTAPMLPVVSDSKGGNSLVPVAGLLPVWAQTSLQRPDGLYLSSWNVFWRILNPLSAGDTVTLTNVRGPALWMELDVNDITGLTAANPIGPNAGGNYTQIGQSPGVSPFTSTAAPTPKWTGPILIGAGYLIPDSGIADVMLARGGVEISPLFGSSVGGLTKYVQAPLPELHLGPQDTLTAASFDFSNQRLGDTISNFLVWGIDE